MITLHFRGLGASIPDPHWPASFTTLARVDAERLGRALARVPAAAPVAMAQVPLELVPPEGAAVLE